VFKQLLLQSVEIRLTNEKDFPFGQQVVTENEKDFTFGQVVTENENYVVELSTDVSQEVAECMEDTVQQVAVVEVSFCFSWLFDEYKETPSSKIKRSQPSSLAQNKMSRTDVCRHLWSPPARRQQFLYTVRTATTFAAHTLAWTALQRTLWEKHLIWLDNMFFILLCYYRMPSLCYYAWTEYCCSNKLINSLTFASVMHSYTTHCK